MAQEQRPKTDHVAKKQTTKKPPIAAKPAHLTLRANRKNGISPYLQVSKSFERDRATLQPHDVKNSTEIRKVKSGRLEGSRQYERLAGLRHSHSAPDVARRCAPYCGKRAAVHLSSETDSYVQINIPAVAPGTMFRMNALTGELRCASQEDATKFFEENNNNLLRKRSSDSETDCDARCCVNGAENATTLPHWRTQVDEDGYEVPLALKRDVYFSLGSDLCVSSADESDATDSFQVFNRHEKPKRFAKKKEQRPRTAPNNFLRSYSRRIAKNADASVRQDAVDGTLSRSVPQSKPDNPIRQLNSFLSSRLWTGQKPSAVAAYQRDGSSYSTDEWSSNSSDECSSCEDYYQEIAAPQFDANFSDHDYECIDQDDTDTDSQKVCKHRTKKRMMKAVVASVGIGKKDKSLSKSADSRNGSPVPSPYSNRKHLNEIRAVHNSECTWDTVATPGVLKLESFRNLRTSNRETKPTGVC